MGRKLIAGTLLAIIVIALIVAWDSNWLERASWVAGVIGGGAVCASLLGWAWQRPSATAQVSSREQISQAAHTLADLVRRQWEEEAKIRCLFDPSPLTVRWRLTDNELMDHPQHIAPRGKPRFPNTNGQIQSMAKALRALNRRRLVIIGPAGTGKTTLALLLLRHLLAFPVPGDPVPVLFTLSTWDPATKRYPAWLTQRLRDDYPALRADEFGPTAISDLIGDGRIIPILDGLDELPPQRRRQVVHALNTQLTDRDGFILTCRTEEYRHTITFRAPQQPGDVLTAAAVIQPDPLNGVDIATYLASCLPPVPGGSWPLLLRRLAKPDDILGQTLNTALMVWLVRTVYVDTRNDPAPLLEAVTSPEPNAVRDHLLDHVIVALLTIANNMASCDHGRCHRIWQPACAEQWLSEIAAHLTRLGTRDLAWWKLYLMLPPHRIRLAAGLLSGLLGGMLCGVAAAGSEGKSGWGLATVFFAATVGASVGGCAAAFVNRLPLSGDSPTRTYLRGGALVGLGSAPLYPQATGSLLPVMNGPGGVLVHGFLISLVFGLLSGFLKLDSKPARANFTFRNPSRRRLASRLKTRLMAGLTGGLAAGSVVALGIWISHGFVDGLAGLVGQAGLGIWFTLCALVWSVYGVLQWATTPTASDDIRDPITSIIDDRRLNVVTWFAYAILYGLVFCYVGGVAFGLAIGLIGAFGSILVNGRAWPVYYLASIQLAFTRQQPWQSRKSLADMHSAGILRQVGGVYQFRHAALHDKLASKITPTSKT